MKPKPLAFAIAAVAAAAIFFYAAPFQGSPQPVAGLLPPGALLTLEARDFHAELTRWNGSEEKTRWLASARYQGFQTSKLYLRLEQAWQEFSAASGFVPDWALVDSLAGRESALAIYDIGNLEFLYVTRLPAARAAESALWKARGQYETRHAGNFDFYVRVSQGRTVAFASAGDCLVLATREEYAAGALRLLSGEHLPDVRGDGWYHDAVAAAGAPGDLRLVMNLPELLKTPQFLTYWVQRNASELDRYRSAIADVRREGSEFLEERVLVRSAGLPAAPAGAERLARLVPDDAAFYRAWPVAESEDLAGLISRRILAPRVAGTLAHDVAPDATAGEPVAGADSDLETRIDQPPLEAAAEPSLDPLRAALSAAHPTIAVLIETARPLPDGVFVETPALIAIEGAQWNLASVRAAVAAVAPAYVHADASGNLLFIANSEALLAQVRDRVNRRATASDATSLAVFRHAAARPAYRQIMNTLEHRAGFFATDFASLSGVLSDVREIELRTRDQGAVVRETVTYR